jgi:hypothetical protein
MTGEVTVRLLSVFVLSIFLVGCGGSNPVAPTASNAAVNFRLDNNSCSGVFGTQTLTFGLFVDGLQVGSANLGINITSPSFTVTPGSHVASANVTNSTLRWNNLNFSVAAGNTFTYILTC